MKLEISSQNSLEKMFYLGLSHAFMQLKIIQGTRHRIMDLLFLQGSVFSGDNIMLIFEPPKKINRDFYRWGIKFYVDYILSMYDEFDTYGVVLLSGKNVRYYIVETNKGFHNIKLLHDFDESLQKKQKKGGQSAPRFERIRQEKYGLYKTKIAESLVKTYLYDNHTKCLATKFIFAGPCNLKKEIFENETISKYFLDKTIKIIDTAELTDSTIHNIYEDHINGSTEDSKEINREIKEFKELIELADDRLVFSIDSIIDEMKICALGKIIMSKKLDKTNQNHIKELNTYGCTIIMTDDNVIDQYGGSVGIKWFSDQ